MAACKLILFLSNLLVIATASGPDLPSSYHVTGTIYLPKASVAEPFEAWVDETKRMSRIDYYGGE